MADSQPTGQKDLTADDRRVVASWRSSFDNDWNEERLSKLVDELAPLNSKLRRFVLIELVKTDIERMWKGGRPVSVEAYLKRFPELGTAACAPLELISAEWEARKKADPNASLEMMQERFPLQAELLKKLETRTTGTTDGASAAPGTVRSFAQATGRPPALQAGDLVKQRLGRYEILRIIGRGGMGTVYLAHDVQLDRQVALKVPQILADDGPDVLARFEREARAAATLHHPNICPVYDVGEIDGVHYLTMAFIEGRPLSEMLKMYRPFPQRQAAQIIRQVALAMQEAHQKGIIHRDLKPSNILVNQRGDAVVMDFGVARRLNAEGPQLTLSGRLVGTPEYMAPEQAKGDPQATGPASDIYSVGVILYRLLSGRLPFAGQMLQVLTQLATETPPPPSVYRRDIEPALEEICLKAMARDLRVRYPSMEALALALDSYLRGETQRSAPALAAADLEPTVIGPAAGIAEKTGPAAGIAQGTEPLPTRAGKDRPATMPVPDDTVGPPRRRSLGPLAAVLACAAGVALAGGFYYWQNWRPAGPAAGDSVGPVASTPAVPDESRLHFERAEEAYQSKEFDKAIAWLDAILKADPAQAAAYEQRGRCYAAKGDFASALGDFDKALALPAGQTARAYRERGLAHLEKGHDEAANADFTRALARDGNDALAHAGRGRAFLRQNMFDKALADLHQATALDANLRLDADKVAAYSGLGLAHLRAKKFDRAVDCFKQASQLEPKNDAHARNLGDALAGQDEPEDALTEYTRAWRLNPTAADNRQRLADALQRLASSYFAQKNFKAALLDFERKLKQDPQNPWALYQRGRVYLAWDTDPENADKASADLSAAMKLDPALAPDARKLLDEAYHRLAEPYFSGRNAQEQMKKLEQAVDEFSRRIDNDPRNSWAHCYRGRALLLQGNLARAITDFNKALELNPADALARRFRGDMYAQQQDLARALTDYTGAKELNPLDVRNWSQYLHALLAVDKGNLEQYRKGCAEMYRHLAKSEDASTLNQLVWLCVLAPDTVAEPAELVELAKKAVEKSSDRNSISYRNTLAAAHLRANQLPPADALLIDNLRQREKPENQKVPGRFNDVVFLAMVRQRQSEAASARGFLKDAAKERDRLKTSWNRQIEIELLYTEADKLVMGMK